MRYRFITAEKALYPVTLLCRLLQVARLMQQAGRRGRRRRRYRVTTNLRHNRPVAPNVMQRDFHVDRPNEKWVADITYRPTQEGWLYLAVIIEGFYNTHRFHSALGYLSPAEFERQWVA